MTFYIHLFIPLEPLARREVLKKASADNAEIETPFDVRIKLALWQLQVTHKIDWRQTTHDKDRYKNAGISINDLIHFISSVIFLYSQGNWWAVIAF
jgi:hypothetical protein